MVTSTVVVDIGVSMVYDIYMTLVKVCLTHSITIYFRECNSNQVMYQELSAKVDKVAYNAAMKKKLHECNFSHVILTFDSVNIITFQKHMEKVDSSIWSF